MKNSAETRFFKAAVPAVLIAAFNQATLASGHLSLEGLAASATCFVTAVSKCYLFTPSSRLITLNKRVADSRVEPKPAKHLRPEE